MIIRYFEILFQQFENSVTGKIVFLLIQSKCANYDIYIYLCCRVTSEDNNKAEIATTTTIMVAMMIMKVQALV